MELLKEIIINAKPLSLNQLYLHDRRGYKYLNPDHKEFLWLIKAQSNNENFDCKMQIDIELHIDRVTSSDYDNFCKHINDSLETAGIIKNDALFYDARIRKFHAKKKDIKTIIRIYKFEE